MERFESQSLMGNATSKEDILDSLKRDLEWNKEELERARASYSSRFVLEYYDDFLMKYIEAIEIKIDSIIKHAKAISEEK